MRSGRLLPFATSVVITSVAMLVAAGCSSDPAGDENQQETSDDTGVDAGLDADQDGGDTGSDTEPDSGEDEEADPAHPVQVYAGMGEGDVCRLDGEGREVWCSEIHDDLVMELRVDDGRVFTAGADGEVCRTGTDGQDHWCYDGHSEEVFGLELDGQANAHTISRDGTGCKIDDDGEQRWCVETEGPWALEGRQIAVDDDDNFYLATISDLEMFPSPEICQFDKEGEQQWCEEADSDPDGIVNVVTVDDGFVYTGSAEGQACKFDEEGDEVWCSTVGEENGWGSDRSEGIRDIGVDGAGRLVVSTFEWRGQGQVCQFDEDGDDQWSWEAPSPGQDVQPIRVEGTDAIYAQKKSDEYRSPANLCKFDDDGDETWCLDDHPFVYDFLIGPDGDIYTASDERGVCALDEVGDTMWCYAEPSDLASGLAVTVDGTSL